MRTSLSLIAAGALAAGGLALGLATPAAAETLTASLCDIADYKVTVGTTVVLVYGDDCELLAPYQAYAGSPTIVHHPEVDGYALLWRQAVGRSSADATCDSGWNPSWAQWMHDGKGGYTCERVIDWGTFSGNPASVSVTVNTSVDFAWNHYEQVWVFGCDDDPGDYGWLVIGNCPLR